MEYRLLGTLEVLASDGSRLAIPAPKRRTLLAALLLDAERLVPVERLAEALWGTEPPPSAVGTLQAHVSRLRREIGADRILGGPGGYRLRLDGDDVDVQRFEAAVARGRAAARQGDDGAAAATFREALSMWRGPMLADVQDRAFAEPEIARLDELRMAAIEEAIDAELRLGRHHEIVPELESLTREHPFREGLWRQLMLALYRSGRQADALGAYRQVRSALVEELGIDPSGETQGLQVAILRQDPSLAGPAAAPPPTSIRLPQPLTSFVGRRVEVERVLGRLRSDRLVTVTGAGGVGKTRLALVVGEVLLPGYPDGVLFVDLSTVREPSLVRARIGEVTGGAERPADAIGGRRMLLILDNFEQVVAAGPEISQLLDRCPGLRVLVTSRAALRVRGEHVIPLEPLPASDAASLFEARARSAAADVLGDAAVVGDIVARLDRLPLAIELAAARTRAFSPDVLRDRLAERLPLLDAGPRDAPQRHRALRDTISWSYELLSPGARAAFRKLSVLAPGFDLDAAVAVGEADLEAIAELVDQSLLGRIGARYAMLETIREFAAGMAAEHGETSLAADRHLAHFLTVATSTRRGARDGGTMGRNAWIVMCSTERDNLRIAFDHAVAHDDAESTVRLFRAVAMFWLISGASEEGMRWGDAVLRIAPRVDPQSRLSVLMATSEFARFAGSADRAIELKREAIELARQLGDVEEEATGLDDLASVLTMEGAFQEARSCLDAALAARERGSFDPSHTLSALVELELKAGHPAAAIKWHDRFRALDATHERFPDWEVQSEVLHARVLHATGRDDEAAPILRAAIRDAVDIDFRMALLDAVEVIATILARDDPSVAATTLGVADRIRAETRFRSWDSVERERTEAEVRRRLGDVEYDRLHGEGRAMSRVAIRDILTV
jgi:predicted ATPase/DNA-binding SARP family transcriptional activator